MDQNIMDQIILGLSITDWATMVGVWAVASVVLTVVKNVLISRFSRLAERSENQIDDIFADVLRSTRKFFIFIVSAYIAIEVVTGSSPVVVVIRKFAFLGVLLQVGFWGNAMIDALARWYLTKEGDSAATQVTAIKAFGLVGRLIIWSIALLFSLDNFGVDVTALIAGLGIGGLAFALAIRPLLEDIFAYFSIVVDRPFVNGDYVVAGDFSGTVEHVGIKTTRFTSISGEEIVFPNSDLLSSRIRNYKKMKERRADFSVGVTYDTPPDKLSRLSGQIQQIVENEEQARFDRGHLAEFGDSAIIFKFVFYMKVPAYAAYMDSQERINLAMIDLFNREGLEFAFPTQTLHVESLPATTSSQAS